MSNLRNGKSLILEIIKENQELESKVPVRLPIDFSNIDCQCYENQNLEKFEERNLSIINRTKEVNDLAEKIKKERDKMLEFVSR